MTLTEIILTIFIMSLFCLGIDRMMEQNMLFESARKPFENLKNKWLKEFIKPIVLCVTCFASTWGTLAFICLHGLNTSLIPYWILCLVATAFVNTFIKNKLND